MPCPRSCRRLHRNIASDTFRDAMVDLPRVIRVATISLLVALCPPGLVHADDGLLRYVAREGDDSGDCTLPVRPCRTIEYALSQAGKGDEVRVGGGIYAVDDLENLLLVIGGAVEVSGGFDRFDHFLAQDREANPTTLTAVPLALSDRLRAHGFHVIVDRKGLDRDDRAMLAGYQATQTSSGTASCLGGSAGGFACRSINLLAHMALADLSSSPRNANDIWGFVDLNTEREYALLGVYNGLAVIDVTDPSDPFEVGTVTGPGSFWRDVKVAQSYDHSAGRWRSHAYVSTDTVGQLAVVDLTELPNRVRPGGTSGGPAHNVFISNVDFATGIPLGGGRPTLQVLGGVSHEGAVDSFDLSAPLTPTRIGGTGGGYSHDAASILITGGRASACTGTSCEVLFDFNEDTIQLWDLSNRAAPRLLSSTTYDLVEYVHSGWPTEDGRFLFVHDELDESTHGLHTTIRVFDLADLEAPALAATWTGPTAATDHNGFVRGNRYYVSTYSRGLTVLDTTDPAAPVEVAHFDTYPAHNTSSFVGAWGVFPFLPSGNLLVSDIDGGLYVLDDRTRASEHGEIGFSRSSFGGEEGEDLQLQVVRRNGDAGPVSVAYKVLAGSAGSSDLTIASGTLEWPDEDGGGRSITVSLRSDGTPEPIERALVRLSNPTGGAVLTDINIANVFVGDSGTRTTVGFAETNIDFDGAATYAIATVERRGTPVGTAAVTYEIEPQTARRRVGRLSWPDGDATARTIRLRPVAERLVVRLSSPDGAVIAEDTLVIGKPFTRPSMPRNLAAEPGDGEVTLSWEPASDGGTAVTGYEVRHAAGSAIPDGTAWRTAGSLTDPKQTVRNLSNGRLHSFEVRATNSVGAGTAADITATPVVSAPAAPTGLVATARGGTRIDLSWHSPAGSEVTGYRIEYSAAGSAPWLVLVADTGNTATSYSDIGLSHGTTRHYRVLAINAGGTSGASNIDSATTGATPIGSAPAVPTGLVATARGSTQIDLSWYTPVDSVVTGYRIEYSGDGSAPWAVLVADTRNTATSYSDEGLSRGTTRHYRVFAINARGTSGASNTDSATTDAAITPSGPRTVHVAQFESTANPSRQGFVRVINHSDEAGEVSIVAIDEAGSSSEAVALPVAANAVVHFNSEDLEHGNADKGLMPPGVGKSSLGDWRLEFTTELDIEVLAYGRTADGFLTALHDTVPVDNDMHRVVFFNPGGRPAQESRLRVVNPSDEDALAVITGIDDDHAESTVEIEIPAGTTVEYTPDELEAGNGVTGALGDGDGKWRLVVRSATPLMVASLMRSADGYLTNLSGVSMLPGSRPDTLGVPLFPPGDSLRQGFVRIINRSDTSGTVSIYPYDETERAYEELTLELGAGRATHFNSDDLEHGNADKPLTGSTGGGDGFWRLDFESELDIEVLAYIRTRHDGFVTSMHDVVPNLDGVHEVLFFNPGSNENQVSWLALINAGREDIAVTVVGTDDAGASPGSAVRLTVRAGTVLTPTAAELESGAGEGIEDGALGDGYGKWRLAVTADGPLVVMSLLDSPIGHLTNLSSRPRQAGGATDP